jgi:hydrogenase maturation protease
MKATLLVGLGNPLMGDEGVGWHIAERLAADPRTGAGTEVRWAGTDLSRAFEWMRGRGTVVIVDALLGGAEPGAVAILKFEDLEDRQGHAHHLSAAAALRLLPLALEGASLPRIVLVGIGIGEARFGEELSPALEVKLPGIIDAVLDVLSGSA